MFDNYMMFSTAHWVGYVDDNETPEMIMKKCDPLFFRAFPCSSILQILISKIIYINIYAYFEDKLCRFEELERIQRQKEGVAKAEKAHSKEREKEKGDEMDIDESFEGGRRRDVEGEEGNSVIQEENENDKEMEMEKDEDKDKDKERAADIIEVRLQSLTNCRLSPDLLFLSTLSLPIGPYA